MIRFILFISFVFLMQCSVFGQHYSMRGRVLGQNTKIPVEFAIISMPDYELWAVADEKGEFTLGNIPQGCASVAVSCMGYAAAQYEICFRRDTAGVVLYLKVNDLSLDEVIITAQRKKEEATTTYVIDRTTLDHSQILDVADVSTLLPGEATSRTNRLTSAQRFALRSGTSEKGNASFGTAVEIDGVRISSNASMDNSSTTTIYGVDTRNISSSNIESVEIITGVPSVEYGDLANGMVKINTRRGRTPFIADIVMKPNTKQYAVGKGIGLGENGGTLNLNLEHTKSISDLASPYTSYKRNSLAVTYSNTFARRIDFKAGFTGNIGGYNAESDPDFFRDTYEKQRDNVIRGFVEANWMINKPWLTGLSASASVNYNDRLHETNSYKSSVPQIAALHGTAEGYNQAAGLYSENPDAAITLIPSGTWYELLLDDNKFLDYSAKLKANWAHKIGKTNNRIMLGMDYKRSENRGRGIYYDDMNVAPTWREYRYDRLPATNNLSFYAQEQIDIPLDNTQLQLTAGLRSDITIISGSEYGTVSSFSPRFNAKYTIPFDNSALFKDITLRAGWGEAVKLPTFSVLYPRPRYADYIVFSTAHAYYTAVVEPIYNSSLKWQKELLSETGVDVKMKGVSVSVSFFNNKTLHPYVQKSNYTTLSYNYTDYAQAENSAIAAENRIYTIDNVTGIVTISDKTGANANEQLAYKEKKTFKSNPVRSNGSPVSRRGLEWIIDIDKIPALQTSFRIDGKYYYYKGLDETMYQYLNSANMANGEPYQYIAYYVGSAGSTYNGNISKQLTNNLTVTTHIPKVRLIFSLRIEASLYDFSQNISEYNGQRLAFVIDPDTQTPLEGGDIYAGDQYIGIYPLYYSTYDDPDTLIPFEEKLKWAKTNDTALYNELYKLVNRTSYNYIFNANKISPYFSANLAVTKEIGKHVSLTFKADNFINNMGKITNSNTGRESTLYNGNYIPQFYYGLSLRIKI